MGPELAPKRRIQLKATPKEAKTFNAEEHEERLNVKPQSQLSGGKSPALHAFSLLPVPAMLRCSTVSWIVVLFRLAAADPSLSLAHRDF